jgi:hypothetical protein
MNSQAQGKSPRGTIEKEAGYYKQAQKHVAAEQSG